MAILSFVPRLGFKILKGERGGERKHIVWKLINIVQGPMVQTGYAFVGGRKDWGIRDWGIEKKTEFAQATLRPVSSLRFKTIAAHPVGAAFIGKLLDATATARCRRAPRLIASSGSMPIWIPSKPAIRQKQVFRQNRCVKNRFSFSAAEFEKTIF